jgi:hypothetical protein
LLRGDIAQSIQASGIEKEQCARTQDQPGAYGPAHLSARVLTPRGPLPQGPEAKGSLARGAKDQNLAEIGSFV